MYLAIEQTTGPRGTAGERLKGAIGIKHDDKFLLRPMLQSFSDSLVESFESAGEAFQAPALRLITFYDKVPGRDTCEARFKLLRSTHVEEPVLNGDVIRV